MDKEHKIHAFYILLILISTIICLITVKWSEIPGLVGYITFALTVSSLSLAVIAIVYTIYSNSILSHNVISLERASQDVSNTAKTINKISEDLVVKIEAIPPLIERVDARVEHTRKLVEGMSNKPGGKVEPISGVEFEKALNFFSIGGIVILYACSIAYQRKVAFKLDDLCEKIFIHQEYIHGFLVGVSSFGTLNFTIEKNILNVLEINETIDPLIKPRLEEIKNKETDEEIQKMIGESIKVIESYF